MANMTLTLDVLANVDYKKIEAEVNKIKESINKIPQKVSIDIDVELTKGAVKRIEEIQSGIDGVIRSSGARSAMRDTARDIDSISQSAANMGRTSSTALRDQIDALTGVSSSTKSARDSADAMKMAWSMASQDARSASEAEKILAASQAQEAAAAKNASYALRDQIDALTGVSSSTKSARDSADAMKMAWSMQSKEAKAASDAAKQTARAQKDADTAWKNSTTSLGKSEKALRDWTKAQKSSNEEVRNAYERIKLSAENLAKVRAEYDAGACDIDKLRDATNEANLSLRDGEVIIKRHGAATRTLGEQVSGLASKFASWLTISQAVMLAVRSIRKMINEAVEVNEAMTNLRVVTNESDAAYQQYGSNVAKTAQKIGSSMTDIIDATTVFARLGYELGDASKLAELTAMLQRVGNIEAGEAQASLTSMIKAFDLDVNDMSLVMDKLVTVGNNFPISVSEIATGMTNASSALAAAGNSFDKSVALLAAANTAIQDASKSSTGLRTITARLRKTDSELDELGEAMTDSAYDDLVKGLTKYNVALQDAKGEYRDTYDIMKDIAAAWDKMTSLEQAALAELAAGNRQQTIFYSIIENFDVASGAMKEMTNASGNMAKAYDEWMSGVTAHIERFKAAFQGLSADLFQSDFLNIIIDMGTWLLNAVDGVVKLINAFGGLKTVFVGLGALKIEKIFTSISNSGGLLSSIKGMSSAFGYVGKFAKDAGNAGQYVGKFAKAADTATRSTLSLGSAFSALKGVMASHPLLTIVAVVAAAIPIIDKIVVTAEEAGERLSALKSEYSSNDEKLTSVNNELKETSSRIRELQSKGPLEITEVEELDNLKKQNEELLRQKSILESINNIKQGQINAAFVETMDKGVQSNWNYQGWGSDGPIFASGDHMIQSHMESYEMYANAIAALDEKYKTDPDNSYYLSMRKKYETWMDESMSYLVGKNAEFAEAASGVSYISEPTTEDDKKVNAWLDYIADFQDKFNILAGGDGAKSGAFTRVISTSFKDVTSDLRALGEQGKVTVEMLQDSKYDAFISKMIELGVIANDDAAGLKFLADMFNAVGNSASGTEGAISGAENAVSKLKESSDATIKILEEIGAAQNTVSSQMAGKSISLGDYNAEGMRDYASALEYVNGVYQLNADKVREIIQLKAEEQIATNDANKALAQQKYLENAKQIEEYRRQLEAGRYMSVKTADAIYSNIQALLSENSALAAECSQYDLMSASLREATGAYQAWLNAQNSSQSGDMFDGAIAAIKQIDDTLNNTSSDLYGRVGRSDYKAAVDFIVPDSVDSEDSSAVNAYMESISDMFTFDKDGNRTGLNIDNFIKKALSPSGDVGPLLEKVGDEYRIVGGKTMQDFADGLGLSLPLVRAMFGELEEYGAKFDWADEAKQTFGDLAVAASDAASTLRDKLGSDYQLSIDVSDANKFKNIGEQCEYLDKTISDMKRALKNKETIGLDTKEVTAAEDIIRAAVTQKQILLEPDIMKVDTSVVEGKLGSAIETLQRFQEAANALEMAQQLGVDTTAAQAELDAATKAVQELDSNITSPKALNIDTTSVDTIKTSLQGLSADLIVQAGVDDKAIIGYTPDDKTATVRYNVDRSAINAFNPPNLTRYVFYKAQYESGDSGDGELNGSANASGSANLRGNWRAKGGRSLVGELGREIIVDPNTGMWYTVGDNGAEFVDIPDGAIVFNHLQSNALLENGRVSGRGRAMVTGSIPVGIGGGASGNSGNGYRAPSSGASSSIENNYDKELETFDWIEVAIDRIERVIESFTRTASSAFKALTSRVNATGDAISMITQEIALQQSAYTKYMNSAESVALSSGLKQLVRNGAIDISQYDEDTQKLINDYKDLYDKALECSSAVEELHESLAQLYKDNFDNVQKDFENKLELIEKRSDIYNTRIDKLEAQGYMKNADYYKKLRDSQQSSIGILNQELSSLQNAFAQAVNSGEIEEGSEAWYEMQFAIEDTKNAIEEAELAVIEYNNAIREIGWEYFDQAQERIGQITSEADFLMNLIDGQDMYDSNGNLSEAGIAANGLHAQNYGIYMAQADKYAEEIKRLNKDIANDPNNTKLLKRRNDLIALQRESILSAKSEKEAMVDLARNGIEVELEAIKGLIDAYNESLDSAKDLYEYQKKIADKTENITELEKQLAAYQNDMSEETRSKIQQIQVKLEEAKTDLKETEYEQMISDSKKMLDDLYSEYEDVLNSRFDDIEATFEELISLTNDNFVSINEYLSQIADGVGYSISDDTNSVWGNGGGVNGFVSAYGEDITSKLTATGIVVENIFGVLEEIAKQNGVSFVGKSYSSGGFVDYTGLANVHGSPSNPEIFLNAEDSKNFVKLRDMLRESGLSAQFNTPTIGLSGIASSGTPGGCAIGEINITIPIEKVDDYNDFVNKLRADGRFEKFIQDVTLGRAAGKSKLSKNKYTW